MSKSTRALPLILFLCLLALPAASFAESGVVDSMEQAYTSALRLFERDREGDRTRARAIFSQCAGYGDSAQYIDYIDTAAALDGEDFVAAVRLLEPLAAADFLDSHALLPYVRARHSEASGDFMHAILLYREMNVRDSLDRLIALRLLYPDYFPAVSDHPPNAVDGGYAYVIDELLPVWTKPGGGEQMDALPRFTRVQTLAFAYAGDDSLWACVIRPDVFSYQMEGYSDDIFGFVPAEALHYTGNE